MKLRLSPLFRILLAVIAVVFALTGPAAAQDTQYWTQQYGTRAQLLGGAVVGSFLDLSATFYNPGAISLMDNPEVLLSANAFELVDMRVEKQSGNAENLSSTRFGTAPGLFTGLFPSGWLPGQLAYSALTRQEFNLRLNTQSVGEITIDEFPDPVEYSAETLFDQDLAENWFGATWSNTVAPNVGFGGTMYVAYRGQRTRVQSTTNAVTDIGDGVAVNFTDEFSYSHFRLVWKFGLAWDNDPLTLGVALTTPSVGLFGWGSAQYNRSIIGLDLDGDNQPDSKLAADTQNDLTPDYRSPVSIAAGGSYRWGSTTVHLSAEWFNAVDKYQVLDASDLPQKFPGVSVTQRVTQELKSVLNWGVGVEHMFSKKYTVYGSLVVDRSAAVPGTSTKNTISTWDIYHFSTGAAFRIAGLDLTTGIQYARGSDNVILRFIPGSGSGIDIPIGDQTDTKVTYQRVLFIVGFAFSL
jgi:hypothetical protein